MSKDNIPAIPSPTGIDRSLERILTPIKETLDIWAGAVGHADDEVITVGELADLLIESAIIQDLIVEAHTHPEYLPLNGSGAMTGTLVLTHATLPQISCRATDSGASHALFQNITTGNTVGDGLFVGITSAENALIWNYEATELNIGTEAKRHIRCWPSAATDLYYDGAQKAGTTATGFDINGDLTLDLGTNINEFSTDGTFAGNSTDACPTESATKTYVDNHIAFAEIYVYNNSNTMSVSSAGWTQVVDFDTDGEFNDATPDHTSDDITIDVAGKYAVDVAISGENNAGVGHLLSISVFKNNGATEFLNLHLSRQLASGTDRGAASMTGIVDLSATDTIEVWATSDSGVARTITIKSISLRVIKIGV